MITKEEAEKLYADLIQLRRSDVLIKSKDNPGAIEIHHILPISCGGLDDDFNKIALYAKEHFMAHVYLYVIHRNTEYHDQMTCALMNMHKGTLNGSRQELRDYILASEEYQLAREDFGKYCSKLLSEANLGNKNHMYGKRWIRNPLTKEFKPWLKDDLLPDGWEYGKYQPITDKTIAQKKLFVKSQLGKIKIYNSSTDTLRYILPDEPIPEGFKKGGRPLSTTGKQKLSEFYKQKQINETTPSRILELRPQYEFYQKHGWEKFKEYYSYKYSQQNFVGLCKRYLPEYISSRGKQIKEK